MNTAAVLIEPWKLPIFSKRLRAAGYSYDTAPGLSVSTITLKVAFSGVKELRAVILAAQRECRDAKA